MLVVEMMLKFERELNANDFVPTFDAVQQIDNNYVGDLESNECHSMVILHVLQLHVDGVE